MNEQWQQAKAAVEAAHKIVILQAENPDGDSLSSAIALEEVLGDMGKEITTYCRMQVPGYLHYVRGWDRVVDELPREFDLAIVVDASVQTLFTKTLTPENAAKIDRAELIIFDHHANFNEEQHLSQRFSRTLTINEPSYVATGELLYDWVTASKLPLPLAAANAMTTAILSDSLGLMSEGTTARTVRIVSELMERGVNLSALDQSRRELMKKPIEILEYKGRLLQRIEYYLDDQLAIITIPWDEISQYSDRYNPSMLVLDEMRLVDNVRIAIALKTYPDGKMTAKIRTNPSGAIADKVAEHFKAGGHPYAAGFKVYTDDPERIKNELIGEVSHQLREFDATRTTTEPC
ncbi:MAG TPA: DHH family phosphoesterase [Candidatus Saccharimonadales bacterium]|nr:DHH family phosphoesterase [Candidatus Saccharimonadales bacterium]